MSIKNKIRKIKGLGKLLFAGAVLLGTTGCRDYIYNFKGIIGEEYISCYDGIGLVGVHEIHLKVFDKEKSDSKNSWKIHYIDYEWDKKLDFVKVDIGGGKKERYFLKDVGESTWKKTQKKYEDYLEKITNEKARIVLENF